MQKTILVFDTKTQKASEINDPLLLTDDMKILIDSDSVLGRLKNETVINVIFSSIKQALEVNTPKQEDEQIITIADLSEKKQKLLEGICDATGVSYDLTVRNCNVLKNKYITRWFHLFWFRPEDIEKFRNLGPKSMVQLSSTVEELFSVNLLQWNSIYEKYSFVADEYFCINVPSITTSAAWQKFSLIAGSFEDISMVKVSDFLTKNGFYLGSKYHRMLKNPTNEDCRRYLGVKAHYDFFEEILVEMRKVVSEYYELKYIEFVQSLPID